MNDDKMDPFVLSIIPKKKAKDYVKENPDIVKFYDKLNTNK